jgi:hypothetical protein
MVSDIPQHREVPLSEFRYFEKGNVRALCRALMEGFSRSITEAERQRYLSLVKTDYNWDTIASLRAFIFVLFFRRFNPVQDKPLSVLAFKGPHFD